MNNENLSIGFIGAGRVGNTLGRVFYEKNLSVSGYFSKTYENACSAAAFTHSKAYKTTKELVQDSSVIFITVPDSCIYDVYLKLRQYNLKDKILCHCSGALSAKVFEDIEAAGACGYSVHPAFAVSSKENSYKDISKAFFTVEGSAQKMDVIKEIFCRLGNPYQIIDAENKHKYHASLAIASNLVIGIYRIALNLLEECGFSYAEAERVVNPLFLNNAENVCKNGCAALTGPVDRNDISTVKKHLSVLENTDVQSLYKILSAELIKAAEEKNPNTDYADLKQLLNRE